MNVDTPICGIRMNEDTFMLKVSSPSQGDFLVDGEWLFEVGGKGKKFTQIKDVPNSYVAYDDVDIGVGNKIPLWLFGFLY